MPLGGGPSDKAGNSYERRWTVFALLELVDSRAQTLRIEVPGDDGVGSEFRLTIDGVPQWHQAKRQRAAGPWTVNALVSDEIVQPWQENLRRGDYCVFVSSTGADELRELTERSRSAQSWDEFADEFLRASSVRKNFERLQRAWTDLKEEEIYVALRNVTIRSIGESDLAEWINDRLRSLVTGAEPATAAAVLAQLADDSVHRELYAADVWTHLAAHGIKPRGLSRDAEVVLRIAESADAYLTRLRPLYIGGHELPRREAEIANSHLDAGRRVILAGTAGAGKSVVAAQVIASARQRQRPVLVLSADRLPDAMTTALLGRELGLPDSPVTVLAGVAAGRDALLVIDQLDAVSVASGRHPERLGLISDLLRQARSYSGVRVVLACRQFDIDNDRALRVVAHDHDAAVVAVGELDDAQIRRALTDAGLQHALPLPLLRLLALPLHLALFVDLARAGVDDVQSVRTLIQLYDLYWDVKRTACRLARGGTDEWLAVVERLVQSMNDRQELTVPEPIVDDLDQQVKTMASEGVVTVGQGRVAFFHETFFDYCFARHFVASGDTLRDLLSRSDQDLFRRAQVRQILAYERAADFTRYLGDLEWLLDSPDVRLHLKALVVTLLDTVASPTRKEWLLLRPVAENAQSPLHLRLWQAVRNNPGWFQVLDADGTWASMLLAGGELADQAIWALTGSAADHASRVCELLAGAPPDVWPSRRQWFLRVADVHGARELVELLLTAINEGEFDTLGSDISHCLRQLAKEQPGWAAEVLAAFVRRASSDESTNPFDPARPQGGRARDLAQEAISIATAAPAEYVDQVLPQLLAAMSTNARPDWQNAGLVNDALWSHHIYGAHAFLSDSLYDAMGVALAVLAAVDAAQAASVFAHLQTKPYASAAFLLARGYVGNPIAFAGDAADWLSTTPGARLLGYADAPAWVTRELVAAISSHCSPGHFEQVVEALLYFATPYEKTYQGLRSRGFTELGLLNGIDANRRPARVERRLAELRRKFGLDDVPPPEGITGGVVPPPIPEDRARRMSDRHWLTAMQRYGVSETTWRDGRLVGDASTQAQVLETLTKEDPQRFARLLLHIPTSTAEAYVGAILRGLTGARIDPELLREVCRHIRDAGGSDANRWLVRLIEAHAPGPLDEEFVTLVAAVAMGDPDPAARAAEESWVGGSIDSAALNCTRGAAALAIGTLLSEERARLPLLEPALRRLVVDPQPEVRAAAVAALAPLLYSDPDLALTLFDKAVHDVAGDLLGSGYVVHFLKHAVQRRRYPDIAGKLHEMLADPDDETRQAAARQLTLAAYYDPSLDGEVDALLNTDDEPVRVAAISVFADSITYGPRRDRSMTVISRSFHDPAKAVRDTGERAFYCLDDAPLADYAPLIAAFADSPALLDGAAAALHTLESSREPLPLAILDVCEAFLAAHKQDIGDFRTAAAGDVTYVVRLTLRMRAQNTDAEVRRRCLDLIDQLVVLRAHNIEADLDTIER